MSERERLAWVALGRLVDPGQRTVHAAAIQHGAATVLDRALAGADDPISADLRDRLERADPWQRAEADLARAAQIGARALTPVDAQWPEVALAPLRQVAQATQLDIAPPMCLWLRGAVPLSWLPGRCVAAVGARAATAYGLHVAGEIGYGIAERGWAVASGAALGVDGAVHRGALAAGGLTVAVLAGGIDVPYPLAHAALLDQIAEKGLLITEAPPGQMPQRTRFLSRNRLVAALSAGLVVVEAGIRSGTSVTAERARQLGRPLMAVPGPVTSAMSAGTSRLIRDGATLVTSATDVLLQLDAEQPPRKTEQ